MTGDTFAACVGHFVFSTALHMLIVHAVKRIIIPPTLMQWCIGAIVYWCCGVVVQWCIGAVVLWCSGVLVQWCIGAVVQWCIGAVVYWCNGVLVQWCSGVLVQWCIGAMVYWCSGVSFRLSTKTTRYQILCCRQFLGSCVHTTLLQL